MQAVHCTRFLSCIRCDFLYCLVSVFGNNVTKIFWNQTLTLSLMFEICYWNSVRYANFSLHVAQWTQAPITKSVQTQVNLHHICASVSKNWAFIMLIKSKSSVFPPIVPAAHDLKSLFTFIFISDMFSKHPFELCEWHNLHLRNTCSFVYRLQNAHKHKSMKSHSAHV